MSADLPPLPPSPPTPDNPGFWLCQFLVYVDLPNYFNINEFEGSVAFAVAEYMHKHGFPGNVKAQLLATSSGSVSRTDVTKPEDITLTPTSPPDVHRGNI